MAGQGTARCISRGSQGCACNAMSALHASVAVAATLPLSAPSAASGRPNAAAPYLPTPPFLQLPRWPQRVLPGEASLSNSHHRSAWQRRPALCSGTLCCHIACLKGGHFRRRLPASLLLPAPPTTAAAAAWAAVLPAELDACRATVHRPPTAPAALARAAVHHNWHFGRPARQLVSQP